MATTAISTPAYGGEYSGEQSGLWSWLTTVDHKRIGILYLYTALGFFIWGGLEAVIIRAQLGAPNQHIVSAEFYNQLAPYVGIRVRPAPSGQSVCAIT